MRPFINLNYITCITLFCVVLCFEWSVQEKLHLQLPISIVKEMREQAEVCSKETGVPAENLRKIIDKTLTGERANKEFFYCIVSNTGFAEKDGHFILSKLKSLEIKSGTEEDIVNTVKECNKISKEDVIDTANAIADCIHNVFHFSA